MSGCVLVHLSLSLCVCVCVLPVQGVVSPTYYDVLHNDSLFADGLGGMATEPFQELTQQLACIYMNWSVSHTLTHAPTNVMCLSLCLLICVCRAGPIRLPAPLMCAGKLRVSASLSLSLVYSSFVCVCVCMFVRTW